MCLSFQGGQSSFYYRCRVFAEPNAAVRCCEFSSAYKKVTDATHLIPLLICLDQVDHFSVGQSLREESSMSGPRRFLRGNSNFIRQI